MPHGSIPPVARSARLSGAPGGVAGQLGQDVGADQPGVLYFSGAYRGGARRRGLGLLGGREVSGTVGDVEREPDDVGLSGKDMCSKHGFSEALAVLGDLVGDSDATGEVTHAALGLAVWRYLLPVAEKNALSVGASFWGTTPRAVSVNGLLDNLEDLQYVHVAVTRDQLAACVDDARRGERPPQRTDDLEVPQLPGSGLGALVGRHVLASFEPGTEPETFHGLVVGADDTWLYLYDASTGIASMLSVGKLCWLQVLQLSCEEVERFEGPLPT